MNINSINEDIKNSRTLRVEHKDHNFVGKYPYKISQQCCNFIPCGIETCRMEERIKIKESESGKNSSLGHSIYNNYFCDKQIRPNFLSKTNQITEDSIRIPSSMKEKTFLTLKNVCFYLLKLKSIITNLLLLMIINLHNDNFVSFSTCWFNNTNKTGVKVATATTKTTHQNKIRESKSDSNNIQQQKRRNNKREHRSRNGNSVGAVIMQLCLFLLSCLSIVSYVESFQSNCPSICTCKWKNGKRWVECRDQSQISIPDQIDMETQVLDLSGNNLQILPREVFARHGLLNLQRLHLADCRIGQIDQTAFRGLTNLVELNLAGNLLTSVPIATFSDIPYLRELHLNRNPLQKVEANAFVMVPELVSLDLSHCNIKRIAAKGFAQLNSLEKLYINHNEIRELKRATVDTFKGLHAIELAHNPWNCDCKLRPLKHWLDDQNVPHEVDPTCSTPSRIGTRSFTKLKLEEFACPPELLLAPRYVEATAGENATITCKVESVPQSHIRWYSMEGSTEVLNMSITNRGQQRFILTDNGSFEKTSTLTITNVRTEDSGQYMCVALNPAGKVEANFTLQVDYFVGGLAPLESKEIAGIAVAFGAIAAVLLIVALVFLIRHRSCIPMQSSRSSTNPALSTIWVRKEGSNGAVVGMNGHGNDSNGAPNNDFSQTTAAAKESLTIYNQTTTDPQMSLTSNGQYHSIKNGGLEMNGKIQVTGTNGDGPNSLQHSSLHEFDNNPQYHDSNGSYVNKMMLNGSAYNSPNLANNRREPPIHERASGDGSLTNPDVIPSESFSSINDNNNAMRIREHENNQSMEAKTNPGGILATLRRNNKKGFDDSPSKNKEKLDHQLLSPMHLAGVTGRRSPALTRKANSSPVTDVRKIIHPQSPYRQQPLQATSPNVIRSNNMLLGSDSLYPNDYPQSMSEYNLRRAAGHNPNPEKLWTHIANSNSTNFLTSSPHHGPASSDYSTNTLGPGGYYNSQDGSRNMYGNPRRYSALDNPLLQPKQSFNQTLPRSLPTAGMDFDPSLPNPTFSSHKQPPPPAPSYHFTPVREYGYPSDYGLPLAPLPEGNEQLVSPHGGGINTHSLDFPTVTTSTTKRNHSSAANLSMNPLSDLMFNENEDDLMNPIHPHPLPHQQHLLQQKQQTQDQFLQQQHSHNLSNSSGSSTLSPMRTTGMTLSSGIGDISSASGTSSNTMVMSSFDQQMRDSPPLFTSSNGGTPTPTSSSNSAPHPQVPTSSHQTNGPSSWLKQQVQAIGAHVLPSGTSPLISSQQPKLSNGQHYANVQMQGFTSQDPSLCANGVSREPRIRRDSPDEGIQVESDV